MECGYIHLHFLVLKFLQHRENDTKVRTFLSNKPMLCSIKLQAFIKQKSLNLMFHHISESGGCSVFQQHLYHTK